MFNLIPQERVEVNDHTGELYTTSLKVAEYFDRKHKNVLRDIQNVIAMQNAMKLETLYELSAMCNGEIDVSNRLNFEPVNYQDTKGESRPMFRINRNGFMLLVMGYTGQKAFICKLRFMMAFDYMEMLLTEQQQKEANAFYRLRQPWQAVVAGTQAGLSRAHIAKDAGYTSVGSVTSARARLKNLGVLPS